MSRLPTRILEGIPILSQVDQTGWTNWKLAGACFLTPLAVHVVLVLLLGGLDQGAALQNVTFGASFLWTLLFVEVATGLYIFLLILIARYIENRFAEELGALDAMVAEQLAKLRPTAFARISISLLTVGLMFAFYERFVLQPVGVSQLDPSGLMQQGPIVVVFFYIILPLNHYCVAQFAVTIPACSRFLHAVARDIRVDILRVEDYSAMALPAVAVFAVACMLLGVILALGTLDPSIEQFSEVAVLFLILFGLLILSLVGWQVVVLRNRIAAHIRAERLAVIRALDGDDSELVGTRLGADASRTELLAHLVLLDTLSEWPIGPHLQKIVLFGLVPPFAWVMAATVENALY